MQYAGELQENSSKQRVALLQAGDVRPHTGRVLKGVDGGNLRASPGLNLDTTIMPKCNKKPTPESLS